MTDFILDAQDILRRRLSGHSLPDDCRSDMKQQEVELSGLLQQTMDYGESNSLLIVGMQGSGKSTLIKKCLSNINATNKQHMVVNLNGYLQTDDRIALAEITRQLQLENTVGDRVFGSFSENLTFLLDALRGGKSSASIPIFFILEEFDLFAQHKNQTLLYNLFDITQAGLTPMAVVGLTNRIDVMELLEKRVKSRFSHRQIFICNTWTFDDYICGFVSLLKLPLNSKRQKSSYCNQLKKWNSSIDDLSKNVTVLEVLKKQFHINKEYTALQRLLTFPVAALSDKHCYITPSDIAEAGKDLFSDSKLKMLYGISVLELCLIIAMNHLCIVYNGEPFNFQMVYNEFLKFSKKRSHVLQNYSKTVVLKAFEHLVELELVQPKDTSISLSLKNSKEYRQMILLLNENQFREAVDKFPECPTDVKQWAESSII